MAALGAAAQTANIRMAINKRLASFPKNIPQRFWDDYVWTPNNGDWQRLREHNSDVELSNEHFQLFTEKRAERIQKDKSLTAVMTEAGNAPQHLTEEQAEAIIAGAVLEHFVARTTVSR